MNTFKLAIRGLNRNRRRSIVTLLAIAIGFSAITFKVYIHSEQCNAETHRIFF